MRSVIKKWGNSAAVRLPAPLLKSLQLGIEDVVDIRIENGCIVLEPVLNDAYSLGSLIKGITADNLHEEIDFGTPDN